MARTKSFSTTVRARAAGDPGFRRALLRDAIEGVFAGTWTTLRAYINATIGFEGLATATGIPAKSLMRMVGATGNPTARNLFRVLAALQRAEGVEVRVSLSLFTSVPRRVVRRRRGAA